MSELNVEIAEEQLRELINQINEYYANLTMGYPVYLRKWWESESKTDERVKFVTYYRDGFRFPPPEIFRSIMFIAGTEGFPLHPDDNEIQSAFFALYDKIAINPGVRSFELACLADQFQTDWNNRRKTYFKMVHDEYKRIVNQFLTI